MIEGKCSDILVVVLTPRKGSWIRIRILVAMRVSWLLRARVYRFTIPRVSICSHGLPYDAIHARNSSKSRRLAGDSDAEVNNSHFAIAAVIDRSARGTTACPSLRMKRSASLPNSKLETRGKGIAETWRKSRASSVSSLSVSPHTIA